MLSFSGAGVEATWTNEKKDGLFSLPNKTKPCQRPLGRIKCSALNAALNETACIKCNAVSILSFYVAARDSLKANLTTWPPTFN